MDSNWKCLNAHQQYSDECATYDFTYIKFKIQPNTLMCIHMRILVTLWGEWLGQGRKRVLECSIFFFQLKYIWLTMLCSFQVYTKMITFFRCFSDYIPYSLLQNTEFIYFIWNCMLCSVVQSYPTLCNPVDCNPPGFSVCGASPGKNTGVVWKISSRGSSQARNGTSVSRIAGGFSTIWATRERDMKLSVY